MLLPGHAPASPRLFRTPDGVPYAAIEGRVFALPSVHAEEFFRYRFWRATGRAAKPKELRDELQNLAARAKYEGDTHPVFCRLGEHDGRTYLDLGDGRVVEIDADGWRVLDESPIYFTRSPGMLPIAAPVAGGSIDRLWDFVRVPVEDRLRVLAWLVTAVRARGPYWCLALLGEAGSAKSSAARFLRRLIDPSSADLRSSITDDMLISASRSWVMAIDNARTLTRSQSDTMCRLATGAGQGKRTLYTTGDETILRACRPAIVTGIGEIVTEPDLLDRTLRITMVRDGAYRSESELDREFTNAAPGILGALLGMVSEAIATLPDVLAAGYTWPRMADAASFAVAAIGPAVIDALADGATDQHAVALDSSMLIPVLQMLVARGTWRGTARELLDRLTMLAGGRSIGWPVTPSQLSGELRMLSGALRSIGIEVAHGRTSAGRWIQVSPVKLSSVGERAA